MKVDHSLTKPFNKVIITGVTGYIGMALAKKLLKNGVSVYGVGRNIKKMALLKQYNNFFPVIADFIEYDKLATLINDRNFDMFWHFAWQGTNNGEYNDYDVQIVNIRAACDAAVSAVSLDSNKISFACSNYQKGKTNNTPEDLNLNPIYYGTIKQCASDLYKAIAYKNNIPCINIILPNTFGPYGRDNTAIFLFIKRLLLNEPLNLINGNYQDDWMPIDDIVDGVISASMSTLKNADYYVGHRHITTFREKIIEMKHVLNSSSKLNWGEYPDYFHVDYSCFDLDALYRDTGWEAKISFADSILQTAEWVKTII